MKIFQRIGRYCLLGIVLSFITIPNVSIAYNYQAALEEAVDTSVTDDWINLSNILEKWWIVQTGEPGNQVRDFIAWIAVEVLIPVFLYGGILVAIIWFYKLMTSKTDEDVKNAWNYLLRGTIGIVIMITAGYIVNQLGGEEGKTNIFWTIGAGTNTDVSGALIAMDLYDKVFFPIVKLFIFLILGIFFILAVVAGFKYIFSADEGAQQKSLKTLLRTVFGSVIIILAKEMVETIYGKYNTVLRPVSDLGDIGEWVFQEPEFPILYTAINRFLGLVMFLVLIIIVYQWYLLLTQPTNEENMGKLKKNFVYIFIGILIIGAAYLLSNFFIIK